MRLLLDTHTFLWYDSGDRRFRHAVRVAIEDVSNEAYLSVASIWECVVKQQKGKLPLPAAAETHVPAVCSRLGIRILPIDLGGVAEVARLPALHGDPFDRIIIAQAIQHGLTLVTEDSLIRQYPVTCF